MSKLLFALLILCPALLLAQDSLFHKPQFEFDLGLGIYYQFSSFGSSELHDAKLHSVLTPRRKNEPEVQSNWNLNNNQVTDNPLFHGAYFFELGTKVQLAKGFNVTAAFIAEQRGFSDGRFSTNTINLFPYLNASYSRTFGKFSYLFQVGDFYNPTLYEGLTFYNIQTTQSWIFKLKYDKFYIKQFGVADLIKNLGLGIDDIYDYSIGIENIDLSSSSLLVLDIRFGYSNNRKFFENPKFWNLSLNLDYNERWIFYTQFSTRNVERSGDAFLIGAKLSKQSLARLEVETKVEYRTYGAGFNEGFINNVYYRDPNGGASFQNSTHDVFAPLITYERPFSQWAVFAEYQRQNVSGIIIQGSMAYKLIKGVYLKGAVDLNWIVLQRAGSFVYPFYAIGIGGKPSKDIEIFLEYNNRVINLDKHYPTIYAAAKPYFLIRAFKPLKFKSENDNLHRL